MSERLGLALKRVHSNRVPELVVLGTVGTHLFQLPSCRSWPPFLRVLKGELLNIGVFADDASGARDHVFLGRLVHFGECKRLEVWSVDQRSREVLLKRDS